MRNRKTPSTATILADDILVTDDITEAIADRWSAYGLCAAVLSGSVTFAVAGQTFTARRGDSIVRMPGQSLDLVCPDPDFTMVAILVSDTFLRQAQPKELSATHGLLAPIDSVVLHGTDGLARRLASDIRDIESRLTDDFHFFHTAIVARAVGTLLIDIADMQARDGYVTAKGETKARVVFRQFIGLLEGGLYRSQRQTSAYADSLGISAAYLSQCCKKAGGDSVSHFIDLFTTRDLVLQLRDTTRPLKAIADSLCFPSVPMLNRYAHRMLGMSPTEYRTTFCSAC